ncbi:F0F1 ATP synthase subunit epsilon [Terasakiispira papahanaumokuakeensis]|uniref:ATP synthase epsilon chain n=1 Tax=Terasakiispira papahanaumokuakeensis TaxID=197479 RepID=A0A1E2VCW8_9GAMM|nr:F0F1 ATP synthase subunit epsilon [Terasakiispira papahanaumokuakeensis]ODC04793.1 F0F1 ATP synthase subunit epsilon [Terasakiispira papahanaumokuakeensis]
MAMTLHCDIVSAEQSIFSGRAEMLIAAGAAGDLGIMPGHTPLLTELKPGPVRVVLQDGKEEIFYVSSGFLEVQPNVVTVLADSADRAENLDEAAAQEAQREAERAMKDQKSDLDYARATVELAEAAAQLRTLQQLRKKTQ